MLIFSFTPRSARWLFTHGKIEEAKETIKKFAKRNKRAEPDFDDLDNIIKDEQEKDKASSSYNYLSLLKYSSTRKSTLLLSFCWQVFCLYLTLRADVTA